MTEKAKHTPGPWEAGCNGRSIVSFECGRKTVCVLPWVHARRGESKESYAIRLRTAQANACLIAAAPDLAKALNDLVQFINSDSQSLEEVVRVTETACAALAKAGY